jgi:hypothetical protein
MKSKASMCMKSSKLPQNSLVLTKPFASSSLLDPWEYTRCQFSFAKLVSNKEPRCIRHRNSHNLTIFRQTHETKLALFN